MSRFCLALRLTLDSALPIARALRLSLRATDNAAFQAQADRIAKRVGKGEEVANATGTNPIFPAEFLATLSLGELSGQMPEAMAKQAEYYREVTARWTKALARARGWGVAGLVGVFIIVAIFRMAGVYIQALGG